MGIRILRTESGYQLGEFHASGLAPQECRALLLIANGASSNECTKTLNCSRSSMQDRVSNMFYKLNVNSRPQLVGKALQSGFLRFLMLAAAINISVAMPDNSTLVRVRVASAPARKEMKTA